MASKKEMQVEHGNDEQSELAREKCGSHKGVQPQLIPIAALQNTEIDLYQPFTCLSIISVFHRRPFLLSRRQSSPALDSHPLLLQLHHCLLAAETYTT